MRGFTLIELMIAVAVVAVLAAVAIPSYNDSVRKGRRGQAKADLVEAAQLLERYRTINGTYTSATPANAGFPTQSPRTGLAYYTIALSGTTATTFVLTATPTTAGRQNADSCGALAINAVGLKTHTAGNDQQCGFGAVGP